MMLHTDSTTIYFKMFWWHTWFHKICRLEFMGCSIGIKKIKPEICICISRQNVFHCTSFFIGTRNIKVNKVKNTTSDHNSIHRWRLQAQTTSIQNFSTAHLFHRYQEHKTKIENYPVRPCSWIVFTKLNVTTFFSFPLPYLTLKVKTIHKNLMIVKIMDLGWNML